MSSLNFSVLQFFLVLEDYFILQVSVWTHESNNDIMSWKFDDNDDDDDEIGDDADDVTTTPVTMLTTATRVSWQRWWWWRWS